MDEDIKQLKEASLVMYLATNAISELHSEIELESENDETVDACKHCSEIADAIVHFPCPTVQILMADFLGSTNLSDESYSPAESEEPSS